MKTLIPKADQINQKWFLIDAKDMVLGRLSTEVASILRGKKKPYFAPNVDTGDYVVVINAEKVRVTGNKELQKVYQHYSGYNGGLKTISYRRMINEKPEEIILHAVKGMLPKNILGRQIFRKLHVYAGENHPHSAQKPMKISLS
jgi:large subunit ribosomal protein L13